MNKKQYIFLLSVMTCSALIVMIALQFLQNLQAKTTPGSSPDAIPVLGSITDFSLTAATGQPFHSADMTGKIWVADFIFTSCAGICPVMTRAMAELQETFSQNDNVQFVSISVDPTTDTPEVLTQYAQRHNADPAQWHFLTGEIDSIRSISTEIFKVGSLDDPINHSPRFILIDGAGNIRGFYMGTESQDVQRLSSDIERLLKEPTTSNQADTST